MKKVTLFVAALLCASSAFALNLKEKKQLAEWQDFMKDASKSYVGEVKKKCGYDIPVSLDEKMVTPFMAANSNAAMFCDSALSAISGMCEDPTAKAMITKSIKKLDCRYGKKGEASLSLKGGSLTFAFGEGAANLNEKVREYLENNLQ